MATLTIKKLPDITAEYEKVEVPEFGEDEKGKPFTVNIRALTIAERNYLSRAAFKFEMRQGNGNKPTVVARDDYDEPSLVTAMCTFDDDEQLTFGVDLPDALMRVRSLPDKYMPAIRRIHRAVLDMSGWQEGNIEKSVEEAEKN